MSPKSKDDFILFIFSWIFQCIHLPFQAQARSLKNSEQDEEDAEIVEPCAANVQLLDSLELPESPKTGPFNLIRRLADDWKNQDNNNVGHFRSAQKENTSLCKMVVDEWFANSRFILLICCTYETWFV